MPASIERLEADKIIQKHVPEEPALHGRVAATQQNNVSISQQVHTLPKGAMEGSLEGVACNQVLNAVFRETAKERAVTLSATISPIRVPLIQNCLNMSQNNTRLMRAGHAPVRGKNTFDLIGVHTGRKKRFNRTSNKYVGSNLLKWLARAAEILRCDRPEREAPEKSQFKDREELIAP